MIAFVVSGLVFSAVRMADGVGAGLWLPPFGGLSGDFGQELWQSDKVVGGDGESEDGGDFVCVWFFVLGVSGL